MKRMEKGEQTKGSGARNVICKSRPTDPHPLKRHFSKIKYFLFFALVLYGNRTCSTTYSFWPWLPSLRPRPFSKHNLSDIALTSVWFALPPFQTKLQFGGTKGEFPQKKIQRRNLWPTVFFHAPHWLLSASFCLQRYLGQYVYSPFIKSTNLDTTSFPAHLRSGNAQKIRAGERREKQKGRRNNCMATCHRVCISSKVSLLDSIYSRAFDNI